MEATIRVTKENGKIAKTEWVGRTWQPVRASDKVMWDREWLEYVVHPFRLRLTDYDMYRKMATYFRTDNPLLWLNWKFQKALVGLRLYAFYPLCIWLNYKELMHTPEGGTYHWSDIAIFGNLRQRLDERNRRRMKKYIEGFNPGPRVVRMEFVVPKVPRIQDEIRKVLEEEAFR
jgi:hypothetical protein